MKEITEAQRKKLFTITRKMLRQNSKNLNSPDTIINQAINEYKNVLKKKNNKEVNER